MSEKQDDLEENKLKTEQEQEKGQAETHEEPAESNDEKSSADQEIEKMAEQIQALKEQIIRGKAENDNLRKRQERELGNAHKYAIEKLLKDLLPVLDSLTLALQAEKEAKSKSEDQNTEALDQFIQGSEMTLNIFNETLKKHGVEEVTAEGEKFNPEKHEAVTMVPSPDHEANTVIHVAQKGYSLNGRTIRAAQVVVAQEAK